MKMVDTIEVLLIKKEMLCVVQNTEAVTPPQPLH